ncbi:MAG: HepT-like ribonuclease domain-containing protein [Pseudomonadota bacterium]|uniref:HepT-like ribonuclease domain-containing protein n=1 Tax=Sphingobium sp. TaxID=1912891 RepID=UPI002E1FEE6E
MPVNRDIDRLALIVDLIDHIGRRLTRLTEATFLADQDEIDLTAFRLLHIGEAAHKLSGDLKARLVHIPWAAIYQMRNVISHDYPAIIPARLWDTATTKLEDLRLMCRAELARLGQ